MNKQQIVSSIAGIGLAASLIFGVSAHHSDPPVTTDGTVAEPIGSPVPVWPTPNIAIVGETPEMVFELPATGAGTTSKEYIQHNHTGWHYSSWCDSGWWLWYRWYSYNYNHTSIGQQQFGNYGRCWF